MANAVSCASAVATIQAMRDEDVLSNATLRGRQLMNGIVRISGGAIGGGTTTLGSRFPFKVTALSIFWNCVRRSRVVPETDIISTFLGLPTVPKMIGTCRGFDFYHSCLM